MPVPGPRTQYGPEPGYRNPDLELPDRFNRWDVPGPVWWPGETPGTMFITLRGMRLAAGQIRRLWRQSVDVIPAQSPISWSANGPAGNSPPMFGITRALRYMTRSVYSGAGIDNSRFEGLHTRITKVNRGMPVTLGAGNVRNRPTIRNRMTSFGSRVPTLNQPVKAAEGSNQ